MQNAKTISITLPPELLLKAQELARQQDRTMSELLGEALRRYMVADKRWDDLLMRTRAKGKALNISSEADVERLSDEYREFLNRL
jgi:predicted transcriptional regulator